MKLEDQVCSLELAKKLKELGVKQESLWYWVHPWQEGIAWVEDKEKWIVISDETVCNHDFRISAFTVAELGEILGTKINDISFSKVIGWRCFFDIGKECFAKTEADARAKMRIYLIEKGLVKP